MSTIGSRIRHRREELGLSQDELAKRLGYKSRSSINKIELDQRSLTQSKIKAIADALETTPSYIMGWDESDQYFPNKYQFSLRCSSAVSSLVPLTPSEEHLLGLYRSFNDEGQEKLLAYAEDLDRTGIYKNNRESDVVSKKA